MLSGYWYNDYAYYKYKIYSHSPLQRKLLRLLFIPYSWAFEIYRFGTGKIFVPQLELVLTTRCTLRCKDCSNLIQYYSDPVDFDADVLLQDIKTLTNAVDGIGQVVLMGGEPLMHRSLDSILQGVINEPKIGSVHVVSNGTIKPKTSTMKLLKHPKVLVTLSEYPEKIVPKRAKIMKMLLDNQISIQSYPGEWQDLGGWDYRAESEPESMKTRYEKCYRKRCNTLLDGKYHICPRSAHGSALEQFILPANDCVQIRGREDLQSIRRELAVLYRLPYLTACGCCKGVEGESIPSAVQLNDKKMDQTSAG